MKNWLEDGVPDELYKQMEDTAVKYTQENESTTVVGFYNTLFEERINELTEVLATEAQRRTEWINNPEKEEDSSTKEVISLTDLQHNK